MSNANNPLSQQSTPQASPLKQCCDLHTHSTASDGSLSPEDLVDLACHLGIGALALTDHDTIAGLPAFSQAAAHAGLPYSCGVEFTTEFHGIELHLLAHFLPKESWPNVETHNAARLNAKKQNNFDTIERLRKDGYPISYHQLEERFPGAVHNRSHIARLLLSAGSIKTIAEAFETLLNPTAGYYQEIPRPSFLTTVKQITKWGGVPVWAHPILSLNDRCFQSVSKISQDLNLTPANPTQNKSSQSLPANYPLTPDFLLLAHIAAEGKKQDLAGFETRYSTYSTQDQQALSSLTHHLNLKESGGSDFHGEGKPDISLGTGRGSLFVPMDFFEELRP